MSRFQKAAALLMVTLMSLSACTKADPTSGNGKEGGAQLSGSVRVDGSSTVFPITEAVAEEFMKVHPNVKVSVGVSGTSGGFRKWINGETDVNNASRPIKDSEEVEAVKQGLEAVAVPVAYDGLSVVVNKDNDWLQCITTDQLKAIWDTNSTVSRWNQVNPDWPDQEIKLYGPGTDSGTFEYFTEQINGKAKQSRADYTASEDDNVLVQGVAGSSGALGYFGYAYYLENKGKIRAVAVDDGSGCVEPTDKSIGDLSYPLARLIYIYPSSKSLERPEVKEFVRFYLENAPELVKQVGYTPLPQAVYHESLAKLK